MVMLGLSATRKESVRARHVADLCIQRNLAPRQLERPGLVDVLLIDDAHRAIRCASEMPGWVGTIRRQAVERSTEKHEATAFRARSRFERDVRPCSERRFRGAHATGFRQSVEPTMYSSAFATICLAISVSSVDVRSSVFSTTVSVLSGICSELCTPQSEQYANAP